MLWNGLSSILIPHCFHFDIQVLKFLVEDAPLYLVRCFCPCMAFSTYLILIPDFKSTFYFTKFLEYPNPILANKVRGQQAVTGVSLLDKILYLLHTIIRICDLSINVDAV